MRRLLLLSCVGIILSLVTAATAVETAGRWGAGLESGAKVTGTTATPISSPACVSAVVFLPTGLSI